MKFFCDAYQIISTVCRELVLITFFDLLKVNHKKTGRKYAMKVVKKELVNDDEVW